MPMLVIVKDATSASPSETRPKSREVGLSMAVH